MTIYIPEATNVVKFPHSFSRWATPPEGAAKAAADAAKGRCGGESRSGLCVDRREAGGRCCSLRGHRCAS
jgi:hypothetical protein